MHVVISNHPDYSKRKYLSIYTALEAYKALTCSGYMVRITNEDITNVTPIIQYKQVSNPHADIWGETCG
jgi:hypothetical protein